MPAALVDDVEMEAVGVQMEVEDDVQLPAAAPPAGRTVARDEEGDMVDDEVQLPVPEETQLREDTTSDLVLDFGDILRDLKLGQVEEDASERRPSFGDCLTALLLPRLSRE